MKTLNIRHNKDQLRVGVDLRSKKLIDGKYDQIVWCNRGLYHLIQKSLVDNMKQNLKNILDHPRHHRVKQDSLIFHWDQTIPAPEELHFE